MSILKELFSISEGEMPGDNQIELQDLIKNFPNQHKKAIQKLWGKSRLTYHGVPFFGEQSGDSDVIDESENAVKLWGEDGGEFTVDLSDVAYVNADGKEFTIEISYQDQMKDVERHGQSCYMGYDVGTDTLYVGWDLSLTEDELNSVWDEKFEEETGEEFDYEDENHQKAFLAAHEEWMHLKPWILFELKDSSGDMNGVTAEDVSSGSDGFYPEGYKAAQRLNLIDLRLD